MTEPKQPAETPPASEVDEPDAPLAGDVKPPAPPRLEPTRYGDWELNGKCVDF